MAREVGAWARTEQAGRLRRADEAAAAPRLAGAVVRPDARHAARQRRVRQARQVAVEVLAAVRVEAVRAPLERDELPHVAALGVIPEKRSLCRRQPLARRPRLAAGGHERRPDVDAVDAVGDLCVGVNPVVRRVNASKLKQTASCDQTAGIRGSELCGRGRTLQSVWYQSVTWNSASFVVPCSVAGTSPPATKAAVRVPPSQLWHLWSTTASLMHGKDWDERSWRLTCARARGSWMRSRSASRSRRHCPARANSLQPNSRLPCKMIYETKDAARTAESTKIRLSHMPCERSAAVRFPMPLSSTDSADM